MLSIDGDRSQFSVKRVQREACMAVDEEEGERQEPSRCETR